MNLTLWRLIFSPFGGPGPSHYRGSMITLRHTTVGRTPLDERSAHRRDLHLTTHNTHNMQGSMLSVAFEPAIPASQRQHTCALEQAATGIGYERWKRSKFYYAAIVVCVCLYLVIWESYTRWIDRLAFWYEHTHPLTSVWGQKKAKKKWLVMT